MDLVLRGEDVSNKEGRTVLFVSHNMGAIKHLCDKALLLQGGSIVAHSDVLAVVSRYSELNLLDDNTPYRHIAGDQSIVIEKVVIKSGTGIEVSGGLEIEINFSPVDVSVKLENGSYSFFVLVHNLEDEVIWSLFQKDSGAFSLGDCRSVRVVADNILLPGTYYLSVGIFDRNNQFIDWVEKAEMFEVLPVFADGRIFDHRLGKVTSKASWSQS